MADYRIVCITKEGIYPHDHVASVGVGTSSYRWSVQQVRDAIIDGHQFHTVGVVTGKVAHVRPFDCVCGAKTILSNPDAEPENDVELLNRCPR